MVTGEVSNDWMAEVADEGNVWLLTTRALYVFPQASPANRAKSGLTGERLDHSLSLDIKMLPTGRTGEIRVVATVPDEEVAEFQGTFRGYDAARFLPRLDDLRKGLSG